MRKLTCFRPVIDPRPAHLEVAGHVVRVPQLVAGPCRWPRYLAARRPDELARRCVLVYVLTCWHWSPGCHGRDAAFLGRSRRKMTKTSLSVEKTQISRRVIRPKARRGGKLDSAQYRPTSERINISLFPAPRYREEVLAPLSCSPSPGTSPRRHRALNAARETNSCAPVTSREDSADGRTKRKSSCPDNVA